MLDQYTARTEDRITGEEAAELWGAYDSSYRSYNENSPVRESLRKCDFLDDLANPSFIKVAVRDYQGVIVGLAICTFDLELLPWISSDFFSKHFPDEYGRILYVAGMFIRPDKRGVKASTPLMLEMRRVLREHGGRFTGFDCSLKLQPWLPKVVMDATGAITVPSTFETGAVEHQVYYLLEDVDR